MKTLKTQVRIICGHCNRPIEPEQGVIIAGNVYMVGDDHKSRGGLIGGVDPDTGLIDTSEKACHRDCLMEIIDPNGGKSKDIIYGGNRG